MNLWITNYTRSANTCSIGNILHDARYGIVISVLLRASSTCKHFLCPDKHDTNQGK